MSSTFQRPVNNFETTLASAHTAGSGTLSLASGAGTLLGTLGDNEVYRVTVFESGLSETVLGVFEATGRTGDQLTGVTAVEGYTDAALSSGVSVAVRATAKTFSDIYTAINALEVVSEAAVTGAVTLDSSAYGRSYVCSGTAADYTVTLPTAAGATGETISFRMSTALTRFVTLDGSGAETIDGQASRILWSGEIAVLMSDGTNWVKVGGRSLALTCALVLPHAANGAVQTITGSTITTVQFTQVQFDNSTRMADLANFRILIPRTGRYRTWCSAPWNAIPANIARLAAAVHQNSDVIQTRVSAEQSGLSGAYPTLAASATLALTAGDNVYMKVFHLHGSDVSLFGDSDGAAPLLGVAEELSW